MHWVIRSPLDTFWEPSYTTKERMLKHFQNDYRLFCRKKLSLAQIYNNDVTSYSIWNPFCVCVCVGKDFIGLETTRALSRRRQWHPTPVLLPGKSHGRRSLVGCSPWGRWVGHGWATSLSLFTFMHWRRKWQPTPVFLPGESRGPGSLVGCRLWGRTESDTTEAT